MRYNIRVRIICNLEKETAKLGEKLAGRLKGGDVVALCGDLGAGKTVLVKGLAKGLGVSGDVVSPTFTLLNIYKCAGGLTLCHYDAYRLSGCEEAEARGLTEYFFSPEHICIIEWAEKIEPLCRGAICIKINKTGQNSREIIIEGLPENVELSDY